MSGSPSNGADASGRNNPFDDDLAANLLDEADDEIPSPILPTYSDSVPSRPPLETPSGRLVICIDYGTTFTGLAFAYTTTDKADLSRIEIIQDWTPAMRNLEKVPSIISYEGPAKGEAQWGSDISQKAVTMANTKLHLKPRGSRLEELDLTLHVLRSTGFLTFEHTRKIGPNPAYTYRKPTEIASDYLSKVFACAYDARYIDAENLQRTKTPVDIVITVPVGWSYEAYNSIFRAVRSAGFNKEQFPTLKDTIMVPEPEAASHFTARDIQQREEGFLKDKDCFVLCDAGGGTVDVISFQVLQRSPRLKLEIATEPCGRQLGSSYVDTAFKSWLRDNIGQDNYAQIDPANARQQKISPYAAEGSAMRALMQKFNIKKAAFSMSDKSDIKLELPEPLARLSIDNRVSQGELTIHWREMQALMDNCVSDIVLLIQDQIERVKNGKHRRIKNVLLAGGFGASPYLQVKIRESLALRKAGLRLPDKDKQVTAVVQGGVVYGIEKEHHPQARRMAAMLKSYGIVNNGRFEWLVKQDSLVLSDSETILKSSEFFRTLHPSHQKDYDFKVFQYPAEGEDNEADCPEQWDDGQHEVAKVGEVHFDISRCLYQSLGQENRCPYPTSLMPGQTTSNTRVGPFQWRFKLMASRLEVELLMRGRCIAQCGIDIEADWPRDSRSFGDAADYDMDD